MASVDASALTWLGNFATLVRIRINVALHSCRTFLRAACTLASENCLIEIICIINNSLSACKRLSVAAEWQTFCKIGLAFERCRMLETAARK